MKSFYLSLLAIGVALSLPISGASAGSYAAVEQLGDHNMMIVKQKGQQTKVWTQSTRGISDTKAERRAAVIADKMLSSGGKRLGSGRNCSAGHVSASARDGYGNKSKVTQAGGNNLATQTQTGYSNVAIISQYGDDHTAHTVQTGNHNIAIISQCR